MNFESLSTPFLIQYPKQSEHPILLEHINELENGDPHWDKVTLLLNALPNGTIKDFSRYNNTVNTNSSFASSAIKKYRQFSIAHSAYANGVSVPYNYSLFDWHTEDYTIDGWNYIVDLSTNDIPYNFIENGTPTQGYIRWGLGQTLHNSKNKLGWCYYNSSSMVYVYHENYPALQANTWYHFAFVHKKGYGFKLFVNGIQNSANWTAFSGTPAPYDAYGLNFFRWNYCVINSAIVDLRITKGVARYTSSFSIPQKAVPNSRTVYDKFSISNNYVEVKTPNCPTYVEKTQFPYNSISKISSDVISINKSHNLYKDLEAIFALPTEKYWNLAIYKNNSINKGAITGTISYKPGKGVVLPGTTNQQINYDSNYTKLSSEFTQIIRFKPESTTVTRTIACSSAYTADVTRFVLSGYGGTTNRGLNLDCGTNNTAVWMHYASTYVPILRITQTINEECWYVVKTKSNTVYLNIYKINGTLIASSSTSTCTGNTYSWMPTIGNNYSTGTGTASSMFAFKRLLSQAEEQSFILNPYSIIL